MYKKNKEYKVEDIKMGFFQDLKEDLSQAVDEMLPDEDTVNQKSDLQEFEKEHEENTDSIVMTQEMSMEPEKDVIPEDEVASTENETMDLLLDEKDEKVHKEEIQKSEPVKNINSKGDSDMSEFSEEVLDETAVITTGMTITGDIKSRGSLDILGSVNGNIDILGKLNVSGNIQGDSTAAEIYADSAKIVGQVHSVGSVKIGQSSVIIGNLIATSAVIAGAIKGDIDVKGPVILDSSAIVMGNIKSKSVQINNGAVIEGLCSQCYADVNPTSFFNEYKK